MRLPGIESLVLVTLYNSPNKAGELVDLLQKKGVTISLDRAQAIGLKLHSGGYIEYRGSRADATLTAIGVEYVEEHF